MQFKKYNQSVDEDDFVIKLSDTDDTISVRKEYWYHSDDSCYWAREIDGQIYYSDDEVFSTIKEDATHIIIFMK